MNAPVAFVAALALAGIFVLWRRSALARRLRTVSSVLASYREGDFSIRARPVQGVAPLKDVLEEVNKLGDTLRAQRLGEMEAWALLRKVLAEVDVVVLAFDELGRVRLANDAAVRVLGKKTGALVGKDAAALGLADLLSGSAPRVVKDLEALGASGFGSWELRRGAFRLSGEPHSLVVLSDVSVALRDQERDAWKRLIRVMGHEINNSLAPIQSLSENMQTILAKPLGARAIDWEEDMASGLSVVARRAEALGRFMTAYAQLARLPPPKSARVEVAAWVKRAAALEQRLAVVVQPGSDVSIFGDADQLDALLINLLKNAAEASLERGGGVRVRWSATAVAVTITVEDDGPGVPDSANLFVPFFTTKPGGSGIGLVLARQIAEAHGGEASLRTRADKSGADATVLLPIRAAQPLR